MLAACVNNSMVLDFPSNHHRGYKESKFYVLRKTLVPAILIECEFISNPETRRFLKEPEIQRALARSIAKGIDMDFSLKGE